MPQRARCFLLSLVASTLGSQSPACSDTRTCSATSSSESQSDSSFVESFCGSYRFSRALTPFATGHKGKVNVYMAQGEGEDIKRLLVWKEDPLVANSDECALNRKLRMAGMRGPGCAASCAEGILLDAVLGPGEAAPAPNLVKALRADGSADVRGEVREIIVQLLQQLELMMLAGVVDLDRHAMNLLLQGPEKHVALIDFSTYDGEALDFGSWEAIPCDHKVAMFGPMSIGQIFCGGDFPEEICELAGDVAHELLGLGIDWLRTIGFRQVETPVLIENGLRAFLEAGEDLSIKYAMHLNYSIAFPGKELSFEKGSDGFVLTRLVNEDTDEDWRLLEAVSFKSRSRNHTRMSPAAFVTAMEAGSDQRNVLLVFEASTCKVNYGDVVAQGARALPSHELQLDDEQLRVQSLHLCAGDGRPTLAAWAGVKPGWLLVGAAGRSSVDDDSSSTDDGMEIYYDYYSDDSELRAARSLRELDLAAAQGSLELTFEAPWVQKLQKLL